MPATAPRRRERAPAWSRYRGNAPRHLIGIARDLQSRALHALHERGFEGVRPSFTPLLTRSGRSSGVLPVIASHIEQQLLETAIARGHAGLKMSHGAVLQHIGPEGARIHEIARIHRVSRQATHATARELEALGYVRR